MGLPRLLVTGATGKQGGALLAALLSKRTQEYEIYALTRSRTSNSAQELAKHSNVTIVEGDFDNAQGIFEQIPKPLWGMFLLTNPMVGAKKEEAQGKALVEAAVKAGVRHIVSSTTDRGGQEPSVVPHFESKARIEKEIEKSAVQSNGKLSWTFLRPVAFYENLSPGFVGRIWISSWRLIGLDTKLQMISGRDVGKVAADAILEHGAPRYQNKAISLAGDEISVSEASKIFEEETGETIPATFATLAWLMKTIFWEQLGVMLAFFKEPGFSADVALTRASYPEVKDFRSWLKSDSAWKAY